MQCKAKSKRTGERCQVQAVQGRNVCYHHGGATHGAGAPIGARNALTHGIYSKAIRPEEKDMWEYIPIDSLDDEIRILKLQFARAVEALKEIEEQPGSDKVGFEFDELTAKTGKNAFGPVDEQSIKSKRPDFRLVIDRLAGRIGRLVEIKKGMAAANKPDSGGTLNDLLERLDESRRRHGVG